MQILRKEFGAAFYDVRLVRIPGVVEGRPALHLKAQLAANHTHAPDQTVIPGMVLAARADRHVVNELGDASSRQESRHQNIRVRPVQLLAGHVIFLGADLEPAADFVVENCPKHARRVEVREAEPVDGAVAGRPARWSACYRPPRSLQSGDKPSTLSRRELRSSLYNCRDGPGRKLGALARVVWEPASVISRSPAHAYSDRNTARKTAIHLQRPGPLQFSRCRRARLLSKPSRATPPPPSATPANAVKAAALNPGGHC